MTRLASFRFSTEALPPRDRMAIWRDVYGRTVIRVDMQPLAETPFRVDASVQALAGTMLARIGTSPLHGERTAELVRDCRDDIGVLVPLDAPAVASQRGSDISLTPGDAVVWRCDEVSSIRFPAATHYLNIVIPDKVLTPLVCDRNALRLTTISAGNAALRLLREYIQLVEAHGDLKDDETRHVIAAHIHDLVALAVGATRDAAAVAAGRGVRSARLRAIKADIVANLGQRELSLGEIAARNGISSSYVRKLFGEEGTSFSEFTLHRRLAKAHRALTDPRLAERTISTIAFESGFGDLSYFNRAFRRRYGASPSDMRARRAK